MGGDLVGGLGGRWSGVVLAGFFEDRGVDQAEDVLAGTQSGRLDHRLHPFAPSDPPGGRVVVSAIAVGAGRPDARVPLVEPLGVGAAGGGEDASARATAAPRARPGYTLLRVRAGGRR